MTKKLSCCLYLRDELFEDLFKKELNDLGLFFPENISRDILDNAIQEKSILGSRDVLTKDLLSIGDETSRDVLFDRTETVSGRVELT